MNINIQSIDFTATDELQEFILEKVQGLSNINKTIIGGDVYLKLEKNPTGENKVCEIKLKVKGNDVFAKRQCSSFEEATVQVVEALHKQMQKVNRI